MIQSKRILQSVLQSRAGQLQTTGRPQKWLRIRLRAALVYTYIEVGGGG
jgi:hypothetical protein